jgi:predicted porin
MKISVLSAAILVACGPLPMLARAQSTVTLYGVLDESIQYVHNTNGASSQLGLQRSNWLVTRWGIQGTEPISSTTNVIFQLESGFDNNTGRMAGGNQLFSRYALVGLTNTTYGEFRAGRQPIILGTIVSPVQPNWHFAYSTAPGDVDIADGSIRMNNEITWFSPNWDGVTLGAQYSFGNVAGAMGSDQSYSFAANYTAGQMQVAAGFIHVDNGNAVLSERGTGNAGGVFFSPVNSAYTTASSFDIVRTGAAYTVGPVTLGGYYSYSEYVPDGFSTFKGSESYNNFSAYAFWQMNARWSSMIGFDYMRTHGDSAAMYRTAVVSAGFALSKRTELYASAGYGRASGQNGLGAARAVIGDDWPAAGNASQGLAFVGIDHRF